MNLLRYIFESDPATGFLFILAGICLLFLLSLFIGPHVAALLAKWKDGD